MNNVELQAIRRSLFLDVKEAVEHVKSVTGHDMSVRAWQMWESGQRTVPDDVIREMSIMAKALSKMKSSDRVCVYYRTLIEFTNAHPGSKVITWRMEQAVASDKITKAIR